MSEKYRGGAITEPTGPRPQTHREPGFPGRNDQGSGMDRRKFLQGAGVLVVGVLAEEVVRRTLFSPDSKAELRDGEKTTFAEPFAGEHANKVAKDLGINAGSFFVTTKEVMGNMTKTGADEGSYLNQKTLLPIFPPAVLAQGEIIAQVSEEVGVPANVLGTISSMESAGNTRAKSGADAHGAVQVVPKYHLDKILQVADERGFEIPNGEALLKKWQTAVNEGTKIPDISTPDVQRALQDPYIGYKVGALVLKDYYEKVIKDTGLDKTSPVAWVRALASYNGGGDEAGKKYGASPLESTLYQVHGIRFLMTAEIAAQLRESGMGDTDIAKELVSNEIDARAFAYLQTKKQANVGDDIHSYERVWDGLAQQKIDVLGDPELSGAMQRHYESHKNGGHTFAYPVSAGLRLWLAHGGEGIYFQAPENKDESKYPANQ